MDIKGIIVAPVYVRNHPMDRFRILFESLAEETGFSLRWRADIIIPKDVEIVLAYGPPRQQLIDLPKGIKLISMVGDVHTRDKRKRELKYKLWERADYVWTFENEVFKTQYPQWYHKHVWIPLYFAGHSRYASLPFNESPKMRCLLSGCAGKLVYPMRNYIAKEGGTFIDKMVQSQADYRRKGILPWKYMKDDYARLLNSYFCCVTTSGVSFYTNTFDTLVAKYFEIPASGSLLLANTCVDAPKAGLVPWRHYVPVEEKDVFVRIRHSLENPEDYGSIRREGMEFVRTHHSVRNRVREMKKVIERICNEEKVGGESCISLAR